MEHQWAENYRTVDGSILHEKAHDGGTESRGDLLIVRAMRIHSAVLGVSGECDVVEFHRSENGVALQGRDGLWTPFPVEYKRGKPKPHDADELQLCGQAMCLEEMLCCRISDGALFCESLPSRERGLKWLTEHGQCDSTTVAPFTGAWIEILLTTGLRKSSSVAPFAGAWIEILVTHCSYLACCNVAPFAGAWIEIDW